MAEGPKLSETQLKAAQEAFKKYDLKGAGQIKVGDLADALKDMRLKVKTEWLEEMEDTIDQRAALESFKSFDKGEGLNVSKVSDAMKQMGLKVDADWLDTVEDLYDQAGTGFVSEDEFKVLVSKKIQADEDERELKEIFRVLDKEKRGEVHTDELRWILKSLSDDLTEEDIDDMIADVDTDGSGWVDYDEFKSLMS